MYVSSGADFKRDQITFKWRDYISGVLAWNLFFKKNKNGGGGVEQSLWSKIDNIKQAELFSTEKILTCLHSGTVGAGPSLVWRYIFNSHQQEKGKGTVLRKCLWKGQAVGNSNVTYFIQALFNICLQKYSISKLLSEKHFRDVKVNQR